LYEEISKGVDEFDTLMELCEEDESMEIEAVKILEEWNKKIEDAEIRVILSDEKDLANAYLTIHPGAGGTESQDWAQMLLRMYLRYCERKGFQVDIIEVQSGDEAGIKSATFLAKGEYAYGLLKAENGIHRLVRLSPFDANHRRHTSFASVYVYPEISDEIEIEINEKDLKIDTYRASGAGGQHVNVTDSAVRITHLPTGIVVQCQNERSQHRNREVAMKVLKARLYELELEKRKKEMEELEANKKDIGWGNQIRSYILHPYKMVKDHRLKKDYSNVDEILDGNIEPLIKEFLFSRKKI